MSGSVLHLLRRQLVLLELGVALCAVAPASAELPGPNRTVANLASAYPAFIDRVDGNWLVWKDGTRMKIDDGRGGKAHETLMTSPDIKDMLAFPYPAGATASPALDIDPGRARNAAFFDKIYGDCRTGAVARNLVDIVWLPKKWGRKLKVTRVNDVAEKLAAVSAELDALPANFDVYLLPPAGTYNCRPIAGTNRVSGHGYGIAVDLSAKASDYWLWSLGTAATGRGGVDRANLVIPYKNKLPIEIVEIFERHGFIWGGKWYHYDTMHFEYRPELIQVPHSSAGKQ
jgi:hypothetical protein